MRLLIDVCKNELRVALKHGDAVLSRGSYARFEDVFELQKQLGVSQVVIDDGYRTLEVREACARYGWTAVYGKLALEIEEACRPA